MAYEPWTQEDWRIREALRSAGNIEDLFRIYRENRQYILESRPELVKFVLRVFWLKFCVVPNFAFLARGKDALWGLPENDPVFGTIRNIFLSQIKINYELAPVC